MIIKRAFRRKQGQKRPYIRSKKCEKTGDRLLEDSVKKKTI